MTPRLQIDMRQFQSALKEYKEVSTRTAAQILNEKAFYIALGAMNQTTKASRAAIEELGVDGYRLVKNRKTGALRRGKMILTPNASARAIYLGRKFRGSGPEIAAKARAHFKSSAEIDKSVVRFLGARIRSIAFLKVGWLPALKRLVRFGKKSIPFDAKQKGRPKGRAVVATAKSLTALIENSANPEGKNSPAAQTMMVQALQKSVNAEAQSMREYIARKMQGVADKFRGR